MRNPETDEMREEQFKGGRMKRMRPWEGGEGAIRKGGETAMHAPLNDMEIMQGLVTFYLRRSRLCRA